MKKIVSVLICIMLLSGCDNKKDAPFGFKWGQSIEEVKKLNLEGFILKDESSILPTANFKSAPLENDYANSYYAFFAKPVGLAAIGMHGKYFYVDEDESRGFVKINNGLLNQIKEKYGAGNKDVFITYKSLIECLNKNNCNDFNVEFKKDDVKVKYSISVSKDAFSNKYKARANLFYEYDNKEFLDKIHKYYNSNPQTDSPKNIF